MLAVACTIPQVRALHCEVLAAPFSSPAQAFVEVPGYKSLTARPESYLRVCGKRNSISKILRKMDRNMPVSRSLYFLILSRYLCRS